MIPSEEEIFEFCFHHFILLNVPWQCEDVPFNKCPIYALCKHSEDVQHKLFYLRCV